MKQRELIFQQSIPKYYHLNMYPNNDKEIVNIFLYTIFEIHGIFLYLQYKNLNLDTV